MHLEKEKKVHGSSALSAALKSAAAAASTDGAAPASPPASPASPSRALECRTLERPASSSSSGSSSSKLPKVILPLWSCFTRAGMLDSGEQVRTSAVVSAEVGIRPSFYWLDETAAVSEEERSYAEANARWMKSDCQDDAVVVQNFVGLPCQVFAGVFDGHGPWGRGAAKFAATQIPRLLAASAAMASRGNDRKRLRAMREACAAVDADMRDPDLCGFDASLSGTTACFAVLCGRKLYLANTGDSRCVLARRNSSGAAEPVQLTWDAKPDHPEELKRIRQSGGEVQQLLDECGARVGAHRVFRRGDDVLPGLAMSRSLGDLYAHAVGVINEPVLSTYTLGERDLFLVLGTDGLWDIMSNEEVVDFIHRYRNGRAQDVTCAEALTLEAQERWKARHEEALVDDISVAIIHTTPVPPVDSSRHDRSVHLRSPLAHAASCNDEANDLCRAWAADPDNNPSYHAPRSYFRHLYADGVAAEGGSAAGEEAQQGQQAQQEGGSGGGEELGASSLPGGGLQPGGVVRPLQRLKSEGSALAAARSSPLLPPPSPNLHRQLSLGGAAGAPPLRTHSLPAAPAGFLAAAAAAPQPPLQPLRPPSFMPQQLQLPSIAPFRALSPLATPSPGAMPGPLAASDETSPRSSLDYTEPGESGLGRLGSCRLSGTFARSPSVNRAIHAVPAGADAGGMLGSVRSQPIPCQPMDIDPLLRPIKKAYPSQSGLCSYKSDMSIMNQETPRSTEGGDSRGSTQSRNFSYEGKLRGGLPRTISAPILASSARRRSLDACMGGLSSSLHTTSFDERSMGSQLAAFALVDSPTDSTLSSPYPAAASVQSPLCPPRLPSRPLPFALQHAAGAPYGVRAAGLSGGGGDGGAAMRGLVRSVSEAAANAGVAAAGQSLPGRYQ